MTDISTPVVSSEEPSLAQESINPAFNKLGHLIGKHFFDIEAFKADFGMTDIPADGFWEVQRFMTIDRTITYLMHKLGMDLSLNVALELTHEQAALLWFKASTKPADFYLKVVRPWFLSEGIHLLEAAKAARKEAEYMATHGAYILAFFSEGRPLFVKGGEELGLVENREDATCFALKSMAELDDIERVDPQRFDYVKQVVTSRYGAVSFKVFVGAKF